MTRRPQTFRLALSLLFFSTFLLAQDAPPPSHAPSSGPMLLAVYEAWFGFYKHIAVGYNEHDPAVLNRQILKAQEMGLSGFVVDWMGDRNPFVDETYTLLQKAAAENHFHIALQYDQANSDGNTDTVIRELTRFHEIMLPANTSGWQTYLTYQGRPVIFIFPYGNNTDWVRVRAAVDQWSTPPLLLRENRPNSSTPLQAFDGFYPWPNPGSAGWSPDGTNWGETYLRDFYKTMSSKFPDKITVGGAWPQFDDTKAKWGKNRHMSGRCGQTYADTLNLWKQYYQHPIPFVLIATWNDYEEGTAIEAGMPPCKL